MSEPISFVRCCVKETNNKKFFTEITNEKTIIDDGKQINIGVYFHICYPSNNTQIVTNIKYAITQLNNDYNGQASNLNYGKTYIDGLSNAITNNTVKEMFNTGTTNIGNAKIKFVCMGFRYVPTNVASFIRTYGDDDNNVSNFILQKSPPVNQTKYLNIWIVPLTSLLGYAYFPWMKKAINGVIINYKTFERTNLYTDYSLNKTMTHEVGHWLGMLHTFQDYNRKPSDLTYGTQNASIDYKPAIDTQEQYGDCVADTPPQQNPTFGDPINNTYNLNSILTTSNNTTFCSMFINFMDYTNDINMFMFTSDQVKKMRLFILAYRPEIVNKPIDPAFNFAKTVAPVIIPKNSISFIVNPKKPLIYLTNIASHNKSRISSKVVTPQIILNPIKNSTRKKF